MSALQYAVLSRPWFILTGDYTHTFTLRSVYRDRPGLDSMVQRSGVLPDKPLTLVAPKGFITDLASIPEPLQPLLHPDGPWAAAACAHDLLYQKKPTTVEYPDTDAGRLCMQTDKPFADLLFLRIMESLGVDKFIRESFYDAVNIFGWGAYKDDNSTVKIPKTTTSETAITENYLFFREQEEEAISEGIRSYYPNVSLQYANIKRPFVL